jgi:peptidoglycan hydrolase CwlO-like protein
MFDLMRRSPGRLRANERSNGVAEHHAHTGLSRNVLCRNVTRFVAVACMSALGVLPAVPAHASTTSDRIAITTRAIDAAAQSWFAAQADAARIDATIGDVERRIVLAEASLEHTRRIATERVVVLYENGEVGLTSMFGDSALDSARRAHLVENANAGGDAAIAQLTAAVNDLKAQRRSLEAARSQQRDTLRVVATERAALDTELAAARTQAWQEAKIALAAARDQVARARADARVRVLAAVQSTNTLAAPTGPPAISANVSVVVTAAPNDGRVSPHHADPFLACTRMRESAGRYDAVNPAGYYGAYQFLPSTWDSTVIHAGRRDLVGELPSRASPFDQDETAWALYQWQGTAPWGGRC